MRCFRFLFMKKGVYICYNLKALDKYRRFNFKMTKNVILNIFILLVGIYACPSMFGQVKRVNSCNPALPAQDVHTIVYEYDAVDVPPQFPGGERGLINFINKVKEYPYSAYNKKIEGRVICSFVINADGSINQIHILKGVESSLNREAVRIIKAMPPWKAGKNEEENVPVRCILPIAFRL